MSINDFRRTALLSSCVLIACGLCVDCTRPADPKADLIRSLNGANVDGFHFSLNEEEGQTTTALTNKAAEKEITLRQADSGLVLKYTLTADTKANTAKIYRSEITKQGSALGFSVTDLSTNEVLSRGAFPSPGPTCAPDGQFESVNACIAAFKCTNEGPLLCEANRTCTAQPAALTCCLKNGQILSVHLIFNPTSPLCTLRAVIPDLGGLVLTQD